MNIKAELNEILKELRPDMDNFDGLELFTEGILDSFDIVSLMLELNEKFDIEISVGNVSPENFNTISDIENLVIKTMNE